MTAHDYLCRAAELGVENTERCDCDLIARARADERERIAQAMNEAIAGARRMAIADERERTAGS